MKNIFKNALSWLLVAVTFASIYFEDYLTSGLTFILGALLNTQNYRLGVLQVCVTTCELADISTSDECNIRGGLKTVYWALYSDIDWEDMAADPLQFDTATQEILGYTMVGGAVFNKLTFERKQGLYDFTYTEDTGVYEQVVTMIFEGKSVTLRNALVSTIGCCKIILHIFDNNCLERVVGVEWDGVTFEPQVKTLRITRHLDSSGEFGTAPARDELDIGGESLFAPIYAQVGETNIPV